ncbi:ETS-related transcription factor Elf-2-like [Oncorhynchus keta]|uniref:ETS-related transcription factor Elf-2-like n=1 Tax=Oncorhynchus keta TaxID=8018 RepID=UPI00227BCFA0|nr:ETS-related transcription factor Elf-2-like [Oncorhynchus keta]
MMEEETDEDLDEEENPAVIVEEVPGRGLEQYFSAQVLVYEDGTYLIQDVGEEQEVETEVVETVEASVHYQQSGTSIYCSDKTIEAAEALLHMDSVTSLRGDRSPDVFIPAGCGTTPDFIHAAMRPDVMTETVVEVSTEDCMDEDMEVTLIEEPDESEPDQQPVRKKKAGRKPKTHPPAVSNGSPDLSIKKKPREGKGSTTYLWEFLLDLLQDKNTCPRYIKWTQREKGIFKLVDSKAVSKLWGKHKNKPDMNYETMGRALRYYYQRGILAKVEGQRLVYQFKEMPKNIVVIEDDKADSRSGDLIGSEKSYHERVLPSSETILNVAELATTPTILRGGTRTVVHPPVAKGNKAAVTGGGAAVGVPRIVTISTAPDGTQTQHSHTAIIPTASGPRLETHPNTDPETYIIPTASGPRLETHPNTDPETYIIPTASGPRLETHPNTDPETYIIPTASGPRLETHPNTDPETYIIPTASGPRLETHPNTDPETYNSLWRFYAECKRVYLSISSKFVFTKLCHGLHFVIVSVSRTRHWARRSQRLPCNRRQGRREAKRRTNWPTPLPLARQRAYANSQPKVVIQTIPTMVPATAENGDKITVQLAKIITIPAHQLAQYQQQTKPGLGAPRNIQHLSPGRDKLLGVRALAPHVTMAAGTQVMRLAVPTTLHHHQQQQTHHIVTTTQGGGTGTLQWSPWTTTTANQSAPVAASHIISGIIKRSGTAIERTAAAAGQDADR